MHVRTFSKAVCCFLSVLFFVCPILFFGESSNLEVNAAKAGIDDGYYRIMHVESGKYADIKDVSTDNGAILQIWDYVEGNQNQIFCIAGVGNGKYTISPNHSKKVIEVRDSRTDDRAPVAQWDYAKIPCQQWKIELNSDGTCSFVNANSGKYMNVEGNDTKNGTRFIQYYNDGTTAEKFKLIKMTTSDIINAEWKISSKSLTYSSYDMWNSYDKCFSEFSYTKDGRVYFPTTSKGIVCSVTYLDKKKVNSMVCSKAKEPTLLDALEDYAKGEATDKALDAISEVIPGVNVFNKFVTKPLALIYNDSSNESWNRFVDTAETAVNNGHGVIVITTLKETAIPTYGPLANGSTTYGTYNVYKDSYSFEYKEWDGSIYKVNSKGTWDYYFK